MRLFLNGAPLQISNIGGVRSTKTQATLPIGRVARVAYELDALRARCSQTASVVLSKPSLDEAELEDCANLDDALAEAQRVLKAAVRKVMLSRLSRHSRSH